MVCCWCFVRRVPLSLFQPVKRRMLKKIGFSANKQGRTETRRKKVNLTAENPTAAHGRGGRGVCCACFRIDSVSLGSGRIAGSKRGLIDRELRRLVCAETVYDDTRRCSSLDVQVQSETWRIQTRSSPRRPRPLSRAPASASRRRSGGTRRPSPCWSRPGSRRIFPRKRRRTRGRRSASWRDGRPVLRRTWIRQLRIKPRLLRARLLLIPHCRLRRTRRARTKGRVRRVSSRVVLWAKRSISSMPPSRPRTKMIIANQRPS